MANVPISIHYNQELEPLEKLLSTVRRAGDYFVSGAVELPLPRVEVEGAGLLSFPVPDSQIAALIQQAVRAPYGRGEKTITDTSVRRVWQLPPEKVQIGGKSWTASLESIVARAAAGLGCEGVAVSAELYKLLVYDPGGFFLAHRDTEKADGMFGTLVIVLPALHRGGELVIRHAGRETKVDLSSTEVSELKFVAFYADCEHEVRPITEGHRVCFVYNLIQRREAHGKPPVLNAPDYAAQTAAAAGLLGRTLARPGGVAKIAWLLEHQYSPAGLSFAALKNSDAARVKVLVAAAARADCVAHLGVVHIEESGPAELHYDGYSRGSHRGRYWEREEEEDAESADFDVVEVSDSFQYVDQWLDPEDRPAGFGKLPLAEGELLPTGALADVPPDDQSVSEATGNEGASFERSYHRAAVVIWHRDRYAEVLLQAGVGAALPYLRERLAECLGSTKLSAARKEARSLARLIVDRWRAYPGYSRFTLDRPAPDRRAMLDLLGLLGDGPLLEEFVAETVIPDYDGTENSSLIAGFRQLGAAKAEELASTLVQERMQPFPRACLDLLGGLMGAEGLLLDAEWLATLRAIARTFVTALDEVGKNDLSRTDHWAHDPKIRPVDAAFLADLFDGLGHLQDAVLRDGMARKVASLRSPFDPCGVVVPALVLLQQRQGEGILREKSFLHLWSHAAAFLLDRSEVPPEPPKDWRQTVTLSCGCEECRELQAFALDPLSQVHRFRVRQDRRQHLHQVIEQHELDMIHVTDRTGRPQTLVCTKDRRSYLRAGEQYKKDISAMKSLNGLLPEASGKAEALSSRMNSAIAQARSAKAA